MISLTAEYALRAVVHLAALEGQVNPGATVAQIARGTRVP
jgi:DNA-binding IscR family transcriptional regulator